MTTRNDLFEKFGEVVQMCHGTALEDEPFKGVKLNNRLLVDYPMFDGTTGNYTFMAAILEDKPLFVGDEVYDKMDISARHKVTGIENNNLIVDPGIHWTSWKTDASWQPPAPKRQSIKIQDTGETRKPKEGEYVHNNGNLCLCRKPERWGNEHEIWKKVQDE